MDDLQVNLAKYRPDMVVAMMGANDCGTFVPSRQALPGSGFWARHFRTYKLAGLLRLAGVNKKRELISYGAGQPGGARPDTGKGGVCIFPEPPQAYADRGKFSREEAAYRAAIARDRGDVAAHIGLGDLYLGDNRLTDALKTYKEALSLAPRSTEALLRSGEAYRLQGRPADAESEFRKVLRLDPRNVRAYFALGSLDLQRDRKAGAEASYKRAIELTPENSFIYTQLAMVYRLQGREGEIEKLYRQALEYSPFNEVMQLYLAYTYINSGRYAQAEKLLKAALEADPPAQHNIQRCIKTTRALAEVYRLMKQDRLAAEHDREAKELEQEWGARPTAGNYRKMRTLLGNRGIALAAVQYPMRSAALLREMFRGQADGVLFVDNEALFKEAVSRGSYQEYFVDMFGGDFGHCTEKGNRLLAKNIADGILKWTVQGQ